MLSLMVGLALAAIPSGPETCNGLDDDRDGVIDDGVACGPCNSLQDGSGSSWLVCDVPMLDGADAAATCSQYGYHLADPGSAAEESLIGSALPGTRSFWMGVNDLATEGVYVYSDGSPLSYSNWDLDPSDPQPDDLDSEDCVVYYAPAGDLWHDVPCTFGSAGAVCEAECSPITVYDDDDGDGYGTGSPVDSCGPIPPGAATQGGDCDDGSPNVNPGETEDCNGYDDDCDGDIDEGWSDGDGDGVLACQGDCDDADPTVFDGATETCDNRDEDCDGVVDEGLDGDGDGFTTCNGDCDDNNPARWPGASELDDGIDDDCDGIAADGPSYFVDADGDGYGDPGTESASSFSGAVTVAGDCDDRSSTRYPGAPEVCNGVDDDCTGWADEGTVCESSCVPFDTPSGRYLRCRNDRSWFAAMDSCRSFGWRLANPVDAAAQDDVIQVIGSEDHEGYWYAANDIGEEDVVVGVNGEPVYIAYTSPSQPNDEDPSQDCVVYDPRPDFEVHDRACKGNNAFVCETCPETAWFYDLDGDGVGAGDPVFACERLDAGMVADGGDCDDSDPSVWSGAAEYCDGIDNDCDGSVDEGPAISLSDGDGDGFGSAASGVLVSTCAAVGVPPGDCDDGDGLVNAGASEVCNGIDDDCNGFVDDGGACACEVVWDPTSTYRLCNVSSGNELTWDAARAECQAVGYDLVTFDTPDEHRRVFVETFARSSDPESYFLGFQETGGVWTWVDGAPWTYERWANDQPSGNGVCGHIWEGGSHTRWNDFQCDNSEDWICEVECAPVTVYRDRDGDGDGDASVSRVACGPSLGWVTTAGDCDDGQPLANTRFSEECDGIDNDCSGTIDDNLILTDWYVDDDGDGFGDAVLQGCAQPPGTVTDGGDCNDANALIFPGATEVCDGFDQDCDGTIDDEAIDAVPGFLDGDGDGYGDNSTADEWCAGQLPTDFAALGDDCDDTDSSVSPGATEVCGGGDDDCDGDVDDADADVDPATFSTWYPDGDGDGYGTDAGATTAACAQPAGFAATDDDCDDADDGAYPGALDIPGDGIDQNCDGVDTASDADTDGDGLLDVEEIALGSNPESEDTDGDGVRDPDEIDPGPENRDTDGDGVPDHSDPDDDGDGVPTEDELTTDTDGDGLADYLDTDSDGDGALDGAESDQDSDGDGVIDRLDPGGPLDVSAPPDAEPGCGCASGSLVSPVWLLALLGYRRSRARARFASSRRA